MQKIPNIGGDTTVSVNQLEQWLQDCEDSFRLDCSADDLKTSKEAQELLKTLQKQRKYINRIRKLEDKIFEEEGF